MGCGQHFAQLLDVCELFEPSELHSARRDPKLYGQQGARRHRDPHFQSHPLAVVNWPLRRSVASLSSQMSWITVIWLTTTGVSKFSDTRAARRILGDM